MMNLNMKIMNEYENTNLNFDKIIMPMGIVGIHHPGTTTVFGDGITVVASPLPKGLKAMGIFEKKQQKKYTVSSYVEAEIFEKILEISKAHDISISETVAIILTNFFNNKGDSDEN